MKENRFGRLVFIQGTNGGRYPFCNSLFIDDAKKAIIDPGSDEASLRKLNKEKDIDIIISSHYHEDDNAFNYLFPQADLYVHKHETACYKSLDSFLPNAAKPQGLSNEQ